MLHWFACSSEQQQWKSICSSLILDLLQHCIRTTWHLFAITTHHAGEAWHGTACSGSCHMIDSFQEPGQFWGWDQTHVSSWSYSCGPLILSVSFPKHKEFWSLGQVSWYFIKFYGKLEKEAAEWGFDEAMICKKYYGCIYSTKRLFAVYIIGYMIIYCLLLCSS